MGSDDLKVDEFIAVFKEMVDVFIGGACFLGWVFYRTIHWYLK